MEIMTCKQRCCKEKKNLDLYIAKFNRWNRRKQLLLFCSSFQSVATDPVVKEITKHIIHDNAIIVGGHNGMKCSNAVVSTFAVKRYIVFISKYL